MASPVRNVKARTVGSGLFNRAGHTRKPALTCTFVERVRRIELPLSAWEIEGSRLPTVLTSRLWCPAVTVIAPSSPWLMAR